MLIVLLLGALVSIWILIMLFTGIVSGIIIGAQRLSRWHNTRKHKRQAGL